MSRKIYPNKEKTRKARQKQTQNKTKQTPQNQKTTKKKKTIEFHIATTCKRPWMVSHCLVIFSSFKSDTFQMCLWCGYLLQRDTQTLRDVLPPPMHTHTCHSHVQISCVLLSTHFHRCGFSVAGSEYSHRCFSVSEILIQKLFTY